MRRDGRDNRDFHRSDIGDDRAGFQMRADRFGDLAHRADRRAEDDQIGSGDGFGRRLRNSIGDGDFAEATAHLGEES